MSTSILPDDSVVIRLARETIHLNAKVRAIHVRAAHPRRDLGGSLLASYPLASAERVRIRPQVDGRFCLVLELKGGARIGLGEAPSQDVAMVTARVVADLTRCKLEVSGPETAVKAHLFEPTGRLHWEDGTLPSAPSRSKPAEPSTDDAEPDTDPPVGFEPHDDLPIVVRGEPEPTVPAPRPVAPSIARGRAAPAAAEDAAPPREPARTFAAASTPAVIRGEPVSAPPVVIRGEPEAPSPVFAELLRESQMYEPVMPTAMEDPDGPDQQATQVGIGGWRGRSTTGTRLRAIYEMLRLTSERLPVATESLAFTLR